MELKNIIQKVKNRERLNRAEALTLVTKADLMTLGDLANQRRIEVAGNKVAFLIDRNINYTNVCTARCNFCAFYRPHNHKDSYDLSYDQIDQKIKETLEMGGERILMQGGLHPNHTIETYENLVSHIRQTFPTLHIHAFSPPEILHVAKKGNLTFKEVFARLKKAGLDSMPGGGAEILVDRVREKIMTGKCMTEDWLTIMETAHQLDIKTTATMMMGHIETWEDRIEHMDRLRDVQDRTHGFQSFIPWTFQPENTPMNPEITRNIGKVNLAGAHEYLKALALSRIFLDNFTHIQVSLLTQGIKVAQIGLDFGADDLGSLLIEENVVRLAGCDQEVDLQKSKMIAIIKEAGRTPFERNTYYNEITPHEGNARVLTQSVA